MLGRSALALALLIATSAVAQTYTPPRTSFGAPDLQGVWNTDSMTYLQRTKDFKALVATAEEAAAYERNKFDKYDKDIAPTNPDAPPPKAGKVEDDPPSWYERPVGLARIGGEVRTSFIVDPADGQLPYTAAAKAEVEQAQKDEETVFDNPEGRPFDERCILGVGGVTPLLNPDFLQIVQTPDHVVLVIERNHDARIIRLGDRRHAPTAIKPWMGDSVGWWEGDTLVVETTNLNPGERGHWNAGSYVLISAEARITERFTRTGPDEILYRYEVVDPSLYAQTWRAEMPLRARATQIIEYACHEGNYSLPNILAGGRAKDRETAQKGAP